MASIGCGKRESTPAEVSGYETKQGKISEDALKVHAKNGNATSKDKLAITIELEIVTQFQTKATTACISQFVEAKKL